MEPLPKFKLWQPLAIMLIVATLILWVLNTLNTGNPLWFLPLQPTFEPSRLVVRNYGETVEIRRGQAGYNVIADALNETFSDFENTALVPLGLSQETLRRYNEEQLVLEAYYAEPIQFNTPIRMQGVNQLLLPIDATHAGNRYVFIGSNGVWRAGVMVVADETPILNAMRTLGYLE